MYTQMPVQLTAGATSGTVDLPLPFFAGYFSVQNPTAATIQFAPGSSTTPPADAITVQPTKSMVGQMFTTDRVTVFWSSSAPMVAGQNTVVFGASDQPIQLQVSDNGIVQVSGNVAITIQPGQTVEIGGTPTVQFAAGQTVDANVTNSTLDVTGSTVNVQTPSGSALNVGGTVNVGNNTLNVTTATGDSVTVAGTIDIGNTPSVTVESGSVTVSSGSVSISNTPAVTVDSGTVNVGTVSSITDTVQNQVVNQKISVNDLVYVGSATTTYSAGLAAGATLTLNTPNLGLGNEVQFDQIYVFVNSLSEQIPNYSFQLTSVGIDGLGLDGTTNGLTVPQTFSNGPSNNNILLSNPLSVPVQIGNSVGIQVTNISSGAITQDTITLYVWLRLAAANITNTNLNVTVSDGTVAISNSPAVTVSSGSVEISNTPAVTVNSGTVSANITNASLAVSSVGSITETVNSQVSNDYLTNNGFLNGGSTTMASTTLAAGASTFQFVNFPAGVFDGVLLWLNYNGAGGLGDLSFSIAQIRYEAGGLGTWINGPSTPFSIQEGDNTNEIAQTNFLPFGQQVLANMIVLNITNNATTSQNISPIITPWVRYASATITNPTSAPVYQQPTLGAFNTIYPVQLPGTIVDGGTSVTETIVPSSDGGYIKTIVIAGIIANGSTWSIDINNGSTTLVTLYSDVYGANQFYLQFPLGDGIANNGLTVVINNGTSSVNLNAWLSVYATLTQQGGATVQAAIQ